MFWIKMLTWQNEQGVIVRTVRRDKIKWPLLRARRCESVAVSGVRLYYVFYCFLLLLLLLFSPHFMCSLAGRRLHWGSFLFFVMLGRLRDHRRRSRGSKGSVAPPPPPPPSNRNLWEPHPTFWGRKNFYGCIGQYLWTSTTAERTLSALRWDPRTT